MNNNYTKDDKNLILQKQKEGFIKIRDNFEASKIDYLNLLPETKNRDQVLATQFNNLIRDLNDNPDLYKCTSRSILEAFKKAMGLGLKIGHIYGECFLISGWNKKQSVAEVQLRIGYHAYINTAYRDMGVRIRVGVVCQEELDLDLFSYDPIKGVIDHKWSPNLKTKIKLLDPGQFTINNKLISPLESQGERLPAGIQFVYVIVEKKNDLGELIEQHFSQPYTIYEIIERTKQKTTKNNNIQYYHGNVWRSKDRQTDLIEMVQKTALTLYMKTYPKSTLKDIAYYDYQQEHQERVIETEYTKRKDRTSFSATKITPDQLDSSEVIDLAA